MQFCGDTQPIALPNAGTAHRVQVTDMDSDEEIPTLSFCDCCVHIQVSGGRRCAQTTGRVAICYSSRSDELLRRGHHDFDEQSAMPQLRHLDAHADWRI